MTSILKIFNSIQNTIDEAFNTDPIINRNLSFKYDCEIDYRSYKELHRDMSRRAKQKTLIAYFKK